MRDLDLSENDYMDLFKLASDAIWVHDLNGNITTGNQAFEKMIGSSIDKLVGKNVKEYLSEDALHIAHKVKNELLVGVPCTGRYEQILKRGDGSNAVVEITTRLITKEGRPIGFQNIARDVTEERTVRDNLQFYLRKVLVAQEEERKRISRDLHDDTIQSLLLLIHRLDAIIYEDTKVLPQTVKENMVNLNSLAREILEGLRRYLQELKPVILDDLGLAASLEWIADKLIAEESINVEVKIDTPKYNFPPEVQLTLFRIAQEAVGNVRKHAGASRLVIRLETRPDKVRLIISDNGKGFTVPERLSDLGISGRLGLTGMQERAQLLGGSLFITSEPGKGTTLRVEIPRKPEKTL